MNKIEEFWQRFAKEADKLADLALRGIKTATASGKELYTLENEPLPVAGEYSVLLDGSENPVAILLTTKVEIIPFSKVPAEFAYLEGEGDRSLAYWRKVHEEYFRQVYEEAGIQFHENIDCVCETFTVVYKKHDEKSND